MRLLYVDPGVFEFFFQMPSIFTNVNVYFSSRSLPLTAKSSIMNTSSKNYRSSCIYLQSNRFSLLNSSGVFVCYLLWRALFLLFIQVYSLSIAWNVSFALTEFALIYALSWGVLDCRACSYSALWSIHYWCAVVQGLTVSQGCSINYLFADGYLFPSA